MKCQQCSVECCIQTCRRKQGLYHLSSLPYLPERVPLTPAHSSLFLASIHPLPALSVEAGGEAPFRV